MTHRIKRDGSGGAELRNVTDNSSLPSYTVATLPAANASNIGRMAYVSNGTSNKRLVASDGTNWRFPDGAVVS